jgi:hypothetical protein
MRQVLPLKQSIPSTFCPKVRGPVRAPGSRPRFRNTQNRVVRMLPNPFSLKHREDRELDRSQAPWRPQLMGPLRCLRSRGADNEAVALLGGRLGTSHNENPRHKSAYARIIGVYALVSSAGRVAMLASCL